MQDKPKQTRQHKAEVYNQAIAAGINPKAAIQMAIATVKPTQPKP